MFLLLLFAVIVAAADVVMVVLRLLFIPWRYVWRSKSSGEPAWAPHQQSQFESVRLACVGLPAVSDAFSFRRYSHMHFKCVLWPSIQHSRSLSKAFCTAAPWSGKPPPPCCVPPEPAPHERRRNAGFRGKLAQRAPCITTTHWGHTARLRPMQEFGSSRLLQPSF